VEIQAFSGIDDDAEREYGNEIRHCKLLRFYHIETKGS
jgi:hypothetical protein